MEGQVRQLQEGVPKNAKGMKSDASNVVSVMPANILLLLLKWFL